MEGDAPLTESVKSVRFIGAVGEENSPTHSMEGTEESGASRDGSPEPGGATNGKAVAPKVKVRQRKAAQRGLHMLGGGGGGGGGKSGKSGKSGKPSGGGMGGAAGKGSGAALGALTEDHTTDAVSAEGTRLQNEMMDSVKDNVTLFGSDNPFSRKGKFQGASGAEIASNGQQSPTRLPRIEGGIEGDIEGGASATGSPGSGGGSGGGTKKKKMKKKQANTPKAGGRKKSSDKG